MFPRDVYTFFDEDEQTWRGRNVPPLCNPNQGVGQLVWRLLDRAPWKIAQISAETNRRVTYHEMRLRSIRVAQNLSAIVGIEKGDMVTIVARNNENVAPIVFGCFMLGTPMNTLDPGFHREDFAHMFESIKPKLVICEGDLVDEMVGAFEMVGIEPELIVFGPRINGYGKVDDLLVETGTEKYFLPVNIDDPANELAIVLCSSGTTGRSKGVCLSHSLCVANMTGIWTCYESDRVLCLSSLYWISGIGTLMTATAAGATRIITTVPFSAGMMISLIEQFRVSVIFFPPSHALAILNEPTIGMADFSSMRMVLCGGGPVSADLKRSFEMYLPKGRLHVVYGLSELGGAGCMSEIAYKNGSVGILSNGVVAKIVDEEGNALPFNEEGELFVKSQFIFMEYYGNPEATEEMKSEDGWLQTGDIARVDEDGLFYIVDRKKDIIKYAGYQISPTEIEMVIMKIPGVVAVCVTGIPVPGNDLPVALVVKALDSEVTEEKIIETVAENMVDFKHLRGGVYFVNAFPMTPSGKILRRTCRDIAVELYNETHN
ncbi:AAEL002940-PA [Aedes aegypti]|uniref:AAEL002940-PA n=2 Tax=Aedes aegypti TaxID=7159 RepID=A0A1S4F363_AEDAE|nr:probable 4-coumarate--CoA ligase 1 [Aedes aegypti]EAT45818.1 AAEL002940-PA [Aedes aegypti]